MANLRALVKRRKAVRNIRKITRTMELIATARFKKALDRATEADAYTKKIAELAADLDFVAGNRLEELPENRLCPAIAVGVAVIEIGDALVVGEPAEPQGVFVGVMAPPVHPKDPAAQGDGGDFKFRVAEFASFHD